MKLEEGNKHKCQICLEAPANPERDDQLCDFCAALVERYESLSDETVNLEVERKDASAT